MAGSRPDCRRIVSVLTVGTFRGFGTERARLSTFRGFGTERARLGTFRGFGTERATLGTFNHLAI